MRFSEKLPKLRKNNNLSQEQLAEQLGVSRQAVSKWEAGNSYPDMEKMLQMCQILNCHLEDLMDDGSIGNTSIEGSKNKIDLNVCMQDFLNFITKLYNMFVCMRFKEKIKFIFEMVFIILILLLSGLLIMKHNLWNSSITYIMENIKQSNYAYIDCSWRSNFYSFTKN